MLTSPHLFCFCFPDPDSCKEICTGQREAFSRDRWPNQGERLAQRLLRVWGEGEGEGEGANHHLHAALQQSQLPRFVSLPSIWQSCFATVGLIPEQFSLWICPLLSYISDCCVSRLQNNEILISIFRKLSSFWLFPIDAEELQAKMKEFCTFQLPYNNDMMNKLLDIARENIKRNKKILVQEIKKAIQRRSRRSSK